MTSRTEHTRDPLIRAFGAILRRYRETKKLSRAQLAEAVGCTEGWIEKMETGTKPSTASAVDFDTFFEIPEKIFQEMAEKIEDAGIHAAPPPGFERYAALEKQASTVHKFEALLITGLLQTDAYIHALMSSLLPPSAIERAVAERVKRRKEVLERDDPPRLWLTLDEWVLRRMIGGPEVMREQLRHLLEVSENPYNTIQILPADTTHYVAYSGSFTVLGLDDGPPSVAYIEAAGQGNLIQDPQAVADCAVRYALLQGRAHHVDESRRVIKTVMEQMKP